MKTAIVSLNQVWEDKEENRALCSDYVKVASEQGSKLVIFPEMTLTGFSMAIEKTAEERVLSETVNWFVELAKKNSISIVFGLVCKDGKKALNKAIVVDHKGKIHIEYSKIHPFTFAKENMYFNSGNKIFTTSLAGFTIGLTICYDLRFPEIYSALSKKCDLIINIANWPKKRVHHWKALLKARAIENQIYIIGVNRTGSDGNGLEYEKSSMAVNADGIILNSDYAYMDMELVNIDPVWLSDYKKNFITTQDRRTELYKRIL